MVWQYGCLLGVWLVVKAELIVSNTHPTDRISTVADVFCHFFKLTIHFLYFTAYTTPEFVAASWAIITYAEWLITTN